MPPTIGRNSELIVVGDPGETHCPDCNADVPARLEKVKEFLHVWTPSPHSCPQRAARLVAEAAEQERKTREWQENPPPGRIQEIRRRVRLPHWTPLGLKQVDRARVPENAFSAALRHRRDWWNGARPARGIWMYGPTDAGKTTLISALAFDISHRTDRRVLIWNVADLMDHLRRDARRLNNDYDPVEIGDAEVIGLDDLGSIKTTERVWETVFDIVCAVCDGWGASQPRQTLYVTSNEGPEQMIRRLSCPEIPEGGDRIVRRLVQICELCEVHG